MGQLTLFYEHSKKTTFTFSCFLLLVTVRNIYILQLYLYCYTVSTPRSSDTVIQLQRTVQLLWVVTAPTPRSSDAVNVIQLQEIVQLLCVVTASTPRSSDTVIQLQRTVQLLCVVTAPTSTCADTTIAGTPTSNTNTITISTRKIREAWRVFCLELHDFTNAREMLCHGWDGI